MIQQLSIPALMGGCLSCFSASSKGQTNSLWPSPGTGARHTVQLLLLEHWSELRQQPQETDVHSIKNSTDQSKPSTAHIRAVTLCTQGHCQGKAGTRKTQARHLIFVHPLYCALYTEPISNILLQRCVREQLFPKSSFCYF